MDQTVVLSEPFANIPGVVRPKCGNGTTEEMIALVNSFTSSNEDANDLWETIAAYRKIQRNCSSEKVR